MAQKIILEDDLFQSREDVKKVSFGLGNKSYNVDLSAANRKKLEDALKPFIDAASKPASKNSGSDLDLADVRKWAAENDYKVSPRGRIPGEVIRAYKIAHELALIDKA